MIDSSVRMWLAVWLAIAMPLGIRAAEVSSSCHMARAQGAKACNFRCLDKPICRLSSSTALPPATASGPNQHTPPPPPARPIWVSPLILPDQLSVCALIPDLESPPRDLLADDCILLL